MVLEVTMGDGTTHTLQTTPTGWKYRHGPIVYATQRHAPLYRFPFGPAGPSFYARATCYLHFFVLHRLCGLRWHAERARVRSVKFHKECV